MENDIAVNNTVSELITAVRQALANKNWFAALTVVLTLPDICAKIDGSFGDLSSIRYPAWYEKYVVKPVCEEKQVTTAYDFFSANDCYALRCAFLHEGNMNIAGQKAQESIHNFCFDVSTQTLWGIKTDEERVTIKLSLEHFCDDICKGVETWLFEKHLDRCIIDKLACLPRFQVLHESESL